MPDTGQMRADLMSTPRSDSHFKISELLKPPQDAIIRQRVAPMFEPGRHARPMRWIARDRFRDASGVRVHPALDQGQISFLRRAAAKLCRERAMRRIRPRDQNHAAGPTIQPMDDARPQIAAY